jgi:methylglutamate dehydrogenase subunit C
LSSRRIRDGGTAIDRNRPVRFTFDGKTLHGFHGDTLASALLANDVAIVARSFKYHRPRGIFAAGIDDPSALVTIVRGEVREPNVPAGLIEIFDGLEVESQNRFPSLTFDIGAVNGLAGKLISAGFYYKTFMGPVIGPLKGTRFWMFCERFIRRAAGLGRAGLAPDPARYERINAFCDVLVVGSGPAGLMAARAAATRGKRVILAEQDNACGGSLLWSGELIDGTPAAEWANGVVRELAAMDNVRICKRMSVWGYYDGNTLAAHERVADHRAAPAKGEPRARHWVIRAGHVVLATGALERPIVFPGNDRPGVMLADAAQRLAVRHGVLPGERIAILANNDGAYLAAEALHRAGAQIVAIIDLRRQVGTQALALASATGAEHLAGYAVVATKGRARLSRINVRRFDAATQALSGEERPIEVDCLLVSGGWSPAIHLASEAGERPQWDEDLNAFLPPRPTQPWTGAGAFTGIYATQGAIEEGLAAGTVAAGKRPSRAAAPQVEAPNLDLKPAPILHVDAPGKAFVDLQHDVTVDDLRLARREGFVAVEHMKRYTTLGMATDQGKTSNVPAMTIMARIAGKSVAEVGTTRFRPPYSGVPIAAIAAERKSHLKPERLTPMHDWHVENGATMQPVGLWHRPQIYPLPGQTVEQAYIREAANVRQRVGLVDVSTLGKIAVKGPDAAQFLDRVYTNMMSTLPVGRARYGLMLREDGLLFDDGTAWRFGEHDFMVTTTTANAARVLQHMEYLLDVVWPQLRVHVASVTDQWAGMSIAGPDARNVLQSCVKGLDLSSDALPMMAIGHGTIDDAPVMICRLSFSGELAYEVFCGAGHGLHVWEALIEAGQDFGILPYGMEALGTLRIEKGHVTGSEIDGRTTARDLYLSPFLSKKKPFVGSAMMDRGGLIGPNRLKLVGLLSLDNRAISGGAQLVENAERDEPGPSIGHVTAGTYSPALGRYIALALVRGGKDRHGTRVNIYDPMRNRFGPAEIVSHHMFDPDGSRMNG